MSAARYVLRLFSWVIADVSSQIPEALWPRARDAIRIYEEGRNADEGTPQYKYTEEIAHVFNRRILGYDREMRRRYPGGRAKILAEEQLEQHKLSNAIALAQVSFSYSWLTSLRVLTNCRWALSFPTFLSGVSSMTMPSTTKRTRSRVFHVRLMLVGVAVALRSEIILQENLGCSHQNLTNLHVVLLVGIPPT